MKRPRITVRTLLYAVAVAAFVAWGCVMWSRSERYSKIAEDHEGDLVAILLGLDEMKTEVASIEANLGGWPVGSWTRTENLKGLAYLKTEIDLDERRASHERALYDKYRRAARYPWLSVKPDPPLRWIP